jgi:protein-tyrosine phosphatase
VLGLIGVPEEVICADYELTKSALPVLNERWRAEYMALGRPLENWRDDTWDERVAAMERTAATVRSRWGGWAGWAAAHGLTEAELNRLRDLLVER